MGYKVDKYSRIFNFIICAKNCLENDNSIGYSIKYYNNSN